ncbi:MAG: AroM family protein, partial [Clostridia bacterium]|nr:AroM family protein [Clostridia bacterium]
MTRIGAITVGQAPRVDVTVDVLPIWCDKAELIEAGALDNLTYEEILALTPEHPDDHILVSRLRDGREVTFSE